MAGDRCFSQGFAGMLRVDGICASWSCGYKLKLELQTKDYFIWAIRIKLFGIVVETSPWFPAPFQPTPGSIIQGQSRRYRHQGNIITPWTRPVNRPFLFEKEGNISKKAVNNVAVHAYWSVASKPCSSNEYYRSSTWNYVASPTQSRRKKRKYVNLFTRAQTFHIMINWDTLRVYANDSVSCCCGASRGLEKQ